MFNFGGGQLPSFGQMGRQQSGGQQQMQPLGQMWQQPQPQPQPSGQLPPMGGQGPQMQPMGQQQPQMMPPQQMPGMVPGVPGSMGTNLANSGNQMQGRAGMLQFQANPLAQQFAGHQGGGFGQFMQSAPFQTMMQSPEAQQFMQSNPRAQRFMPQQGGIMRPMGA